jgi:cytochrome c
MKKLFALGICALVIACGNPSQKSAETAGPDPNTDTTNFKSTTTQVATPASAGTDSSKSTPASSAITTGKPEVAGITTNAGQTTTQPAKPAQETSNAADIKKGEALYSKLDCFACHKLDIKVVGPAYKDVAKKYANTPANINYLADKIIKGGSGVWGQIPMAPHPTLSIADAKALAQYVLSVK